LVVVGVATKDWRLRPLWEEVCDGEELIVKVSESESRSDGRKLPRGQRFRLNVCFPTNFHPATWTGTRASRSLRVSTPSAAHSLHRNYHPFFYVTSSFPLSLPVLLCVLSTMYYISLLHIPFLFLFSSCPISRSPLTLVHSSHNQC